MEGRDVGAVLCGIVASGSKTARSGQMQMQGVFEPRWEDTYFAGGQDWVVGRCSSAHGQTSWTFQLEHTNQRTSLLPRNFQVPVPAAAYTLATSYLLRMRCLSSEQEQVKEPAKAQGMRK